MSERLKSLLLILIFALLGCGMALSVLSEIQAYNGQQVYLATQATFPVHRVSFLALKQYLNPVLGFSFRYPAQLVLSETATGAELSHKIPFRNNGECDLKGDNRVYDELTDFKAVFQTVYGTVAQAVKKMSPYMPAGNFTGNTLKISPGFVDEYSVGRLKGFSVSEGVEGCGRTIYYFPVEGNRILVVENAMVQQLSGVISDDVEKQILALPGAIGRQKNAEMLNEILETITIIPSQTAPETVVENSDWKTYRNEEHGFEISYPNDWTTDEVDLFDKELFGAQIRCMSFTTPDRRLVLRLGVRNKTENVRLCVRTGVGAGEPVSVGTVKIGDRLLHPNYLLESGKAKEIFFTAESPDDIHSEIQYGGKMILAEFSYDEITAEEMNALDMKDLPETKQAINILSTFKFISTP